MTHPADQGRDQVADVVRDDEVVPGLCDLDALREPGEPLRDVMAEAQREVLLVERRSRGVQELDGCDGALDRAWTDPVAVGERREVALDARPDAGDRAQ